VAQTSVCDFIEREAPLLIERRLFLECAGRAKRRRRFCMKELSEAIESKAVSRYACHRTPKSVGRSKPVFLFAQPAVGRRFSVIQLVLDRLERFQIGID
jgi:hypothetical protein